MKTNNPKDSKEENPVRCFHDEMMLLKSYFDESNQVVLHKNDVSDLFKAYDKRMQPVAYDHFPGCHRVHIECANKKIDEAIIEIRHARDLADLYRYPATLRSFEKWLESLGEK